jgi:hypothetical protein
VLLVSFYSVLPIKTTPESRGDYSVMALISSATLAVMSL